MCCLCDFFQRGGGSKVIKDFDISEWIKETFMTWNTCRVFFYFLFWIFPIFNKQQEKRLWGWQNVTVSTGRLSSGHSSRSLHGVSYSSRHHRRWSLYRCVHHSAWLQVVSLCAGRSKIYLLILIKRWLTTPWKTLSNYQKDTWLWGIRSRSI